MANNNREVLALELRQIIQADRMASDIIEEARGVGKGIAKTTEDKKAAILAEADAARASMEKQVWAEEEKARTDRMAEQERQFARQQKALQNSVTQNRQQWV